MEPLKQQKLPDEVDDQRIQLRLKELQKAGELIAEERSHFDELPVIKLPRRTRLDRIIKVAKL